MDPHAGGQEVIGHLPSERARFAVAEVAGKIYAIGGWSGGPLDEIVEIDPLTGAAKAIGRLPSERADFAAVAVKGKICAIGGCPGRDFLDRIAIVVIDPATGSARDLPGPPFF